MGTLAQFAAHIRDMGESFNGTTLEGVNFSGPVELSATISGSREGATVTFIKRYDAGQGVHSEPIFYDGNIDVELTQIDGTWKLAENGWRLSGGFRMQRGSGGPKAAVTREAEEPVLAEVGSDRGKGVDDGRTPRRK